MPITMSETDDEGGTAVRVKRDTWNELSRLKNLRGPNTSFDVVISDLLDECGAAVDQKYRPDEDEP